jgi:DNA-binding NtrC family response regulator
MPANPRGACVGAEVREISRFAPSRDDGTWVAMAGFVMKTSHRVLVVDADDDQLQTLCRGLLYLGHVCIAVRTEADALTHLSARVGEDIDVLLADMTGPGKAGPDLVEQARNVRPGLPMVVVTGLTRSLPVIALGAGGIPLLRKPFTPEQLGLAIQAALNSSNEPKER